MSSSPLMPRLLSAGLVLVDPGSGAVKSVIALQYNPDSLSRSLQPQGMGESGDRSEALRLKAPPIETIKLEAEIDAAEQLEFPEQHAAMVQHGVYPQLAALEAISYPLSSKLEENDTLQSFGTLEIAPVQTPLALFVWSKNRIVPVRITECSVTEEAFDTTLNPLRAKVSLSMRVLSVADLGFGHVGSNLYLAYQKRKEQLAALAQGKLADLGLPGLP